MQDGFFFYVFLGDQFKASFSFIRKRCLQLLGNSFLNGLFYSARLRFTQSSACINSSSSLLLNSILLDTGVVPVFCSVQSLTRVQLFATLWTAVCQASLSITNSRSPPKPMLVMPSNHLIFCCPLLLLPLIFLSIRVFSNESALRIRWPKFWSFNFNISPSNEYSGLISFRMDWLDLLAVQLTLKSLLQHHSSKASVLWHSAFFIVQLSHPYMTTGKTIPLTTWIFVGRFIIQRSNVAFL